MPTADQLASRKKLADYIEAMRGLGDTVRSKLFGRPDEELKGWIERGRAIAEIEDSIGYRLIITQVDHEILWAQQQLEICDEKQMGELRQYLRALRFVKDFVITTTRNADVANGVLNGRERAIGRDTFVARNAQVRS